MTQYYYSTTTGRISNVLNYYTSTPITNVFHNVVLDEMSTTQLQYAEITIDNELLIKFAHVSIWFKEDHIRITKYGEFDCSVICVPYTSYTTFKELIKTYVDQ